MLRQIITSSEQTFTLRFPNDMVGKTLEVIAFEIEETPVQKSTADKAERVKAIENITKQSLVDLSTFKFNRAEANNYD